MEVTGAISPKKYANAIVGNQNKVTENSNLKNNDEHTTRVQIRNIDAIPTIKFQVQNIDSNLNSSLTRQKIIFLKRISIKKYEELVAGFRNVIGYGFQYCNLRSWLSEKNPVY